MKENETIDIIKKIYDILAERSDISSSQIKPSDHLYIDLGLGSLDFVETIFAIENEFNISLPDEKVADVYEVCELTNLVISNL